MTSAIAHPTPQREKIDMTNVTRDEFETVKELLASAARYAESANRKIDDLADSHRATEQSLRELSEAQKRTERTMDQLAEAQKKTEQRLESFIFESQRLIAKHSESIEQLKGMSERLDGVLAYLIRKEGGGE